MDIDLIFEFKQFKKMENICSYRFLSRIVAAFKIIIKDAHFAKNIFISQLYSSMQRKPFETLNQEMLGS